MSRICGYNDTTTGHPCEQVLRDSSDHCEAGHPSPTSREQPSLISTDPSREPDADEIDEFVLRVSEDGGWVKDNVVKNESLAQKTTEEQLESRTRAELREIAMALLSDELQHSTTEIGWFLFPSAVDRRSARGVRKAKRILRSLEHDGLIDFNGQAWVLAVNRPTH